MIKRLAAMLSLLFVFSAISFSQDLNATHLKDLTLSKNIRPVPVAGVRTPTGPKPVKEWTVMVYMNGKSNVEPYALIDMNEMEAVGSTDQINVVSEIGRMRTHPEGTTEPEDWVGVRRYYVQRDNDPKRITSPVLEQLGEIDMGDYRRVVDFVRWAKRNYPAKRYMLVVWDHGWGWIDPSKEVMHTRSISHDFETGNYIKTKEMGPMLKASGRVDLYASMACFMQMMEVAYEIKDYAGVIVGSEEVIQLPSFDFTAILNLLATHPQATPELASLFFVDTFKTLYTRPDIASGLAEAKYGVQLSALRPQELPLLARMLNDWTTAVIRMNNPEAVRQAKQKVLRFEMGETTNDPDKLISFYADLYNFVQLVDYYTNPSLPGAADVKRISAAIEKHIATRLVVRNVFSGSDRTGKNYVHTHGLSITVPGKPGVLVPYVNRYSDLTFAQSSNWMNFMKYVDSIQ